MQWVRKLQSFFLWLGTVCTQGAPGFTLWAKQKAGAQGLHSAPGLAPDRPWAGGGVPRLHCLVSGMKSSVCPSILSTGSCPPAKCAGQSC